MNLGGTQAHLPVRVAEKGGQKERTDTALGVQAAGHTLR